MVNMIDGYVLGFSAGMTAGYLAHDGTTALIGGSVGCIVGSYIGGKNGERVTQEELALVIDSIVSLVEFTVVYGISGMFFKPHCVSKISDDPVCIALYYSELLIGGGVFVSLIYSCCSIARHWRQQQQNL